MDYLLSLPGLAVWKPRPTRFVTVLGPESGGHFRLNLAQTFNSFGAIIAVVFGQSLILSNVPHQPQEVLDKMTPEQLSAWKHSLVLSVQTPYMIIVAIVLLVALLIVCTRFPSLQSDDHSDSARRFFRLADAPDAHPPLALGGTGPVLLRRRANRLLELPDSLRYREIPGMTAGFAANYLTATMVCFLSAVLPAPGLSAASRRTTCSLSMRLSPCCSVCSPPSAAATSVCWP